MQQYLTYGPEYIKAGTLNNGQLQALTSAQVLASGESLLGKQHTILYYGPASLEEVKEMLSKVHPVTDLQPLVKTHAVKQLTPSKEVIVAHYDARQFNYVQYSDRGETLDLAEDPAIELFNEYYGGGMNAIVPSGPTLPRRTTNSKRPAKASMRLLKPCRRHPRTWKSPRPPFWVSSAPSA